VTKVAVFGGPALRKNLRGDSSLRYEFFPAPGPGADLETLRGFQAALLETGPRTGAKAVQALRRALPNRPIGSVSLRGSAAVLRQSLRLGLDFHLGSSGSGDPSASEVKAYLQVARRPPVAAPRPDVGQRLRLTEKAAGDPDRHREDRQLDPGAAQGDRADHGADPAADPFRSWSMLMVDEERQELTYRAGSGEKAKDMSSKRIKIGEGIAGWVAETGKSTIVNDTSRDSRFTGKFDKATQFRTKSILCAPLISRGRTIGVVEIINKLGGKFRQADCRRCSPWWSPARSRSRTPSCSSAPSSSPSPTTSPSCSTHAT
jgi:hypothetical protein